MQEDIKTKDFAQASIFVALGYRVERLERGDGNFVRFVFGINPDEAKSIWDSYWRRELQVDAKTLIDSIHELKTRIHSQEGR